MIDRASEKERKKRERGREEETGGSEMHLARGHGNKPTTKMGKTAQIAGKAVVELRKRRDGRSTMGRWAARGREPVHVLRRCKEVGSDLQCANIVRSLSLFLQMQGYGWKPPELHHCLPAFLVKD